MKQALLERLQDARTQARPVVLATNLATGDQLLLPDDPAPDTLAAPAAKALRADRNTTIEADGVTWFLHAYNPPMRLVIVGAVHIAQALVPRPVASMAPTMMTELIALVTAISGECSAEVTFHTT